MADFIAGQVSKQWCGEGGRSLYQAWRAPTLVQGQPATLKVGDGYSSAGEAQLAVQGTMPGTHLRWYRVDLGGQVESYQGLADI